MKDGLEYFPLNVDFCDDDKIYFIEAKHGVLAFPIIVKILMRIYRNGYYCDWGEKESIIFSKQTGIEQNVVISVINDCISEGLFDISIYNAYNILTSKGIQKRYFEAVKRRKTVSVYAELIIIDLNVYENIKYVNISKENVNISKQSKVEESKVKETKVKESKVNTIMCKQVIDLFNEIYNKNCKYTNANMHYINARLNDGFILEDFRTVFYKKMKDSFFIKNPHLFRISTLCGNKFDAYLNESDPQTKISETGIKSYIAGQEWLNEMRAKDE